MEIHIPCTWKVKESWSSNPHIRQSRRGKEEHFIMIKGPIQEEDITIINIYAPNMEKAMAPHSSTLAWKIPWMEEPGRLQSMGMLGWTWLSNFTFTFHFHPLEKEMATHSSVLAWRIPGTGEPGGLPSMGSHRVWHDWRDLAAAVAGRFFTTEPSGKPQ